MKLAASALLMTGLAVGAGATPAAAATSGCGSSCDGKNPQTYTLDYNGSSITCGLDAVTKKSAQIPQNGGPTVELRYSPRCRTAWARTNGVNFRIYVYSYNTNGSLRRTETTFVESGANYTLMVNDAGITAKACIVIPVSGGEQTCTAKY
jgi:hypothetical protein